MDYFFSFSNLTYWESLYSKFFPMEKNNFIFPDLKAPEIGHCKGIGHCFDRNVTYRVLMFLVWLCLKDLAVIL